MFASGFLRASRRVFPFPVVSFAIVGGGGGGGIGSGGTGSGGGGGGGAVLVSTFQVSLSNPYIAVIGAGGSFSTAAGASSIFGFTAQGGGSGGAPNIVGSNGGCGGGGGIAAGGGSDRAGGTGSLYGFNGASSRGTVFAPNPMQVSLAGGGGGAGRAAPDPYFTPFIQYGGDGLQVRIGNVPYQTFGGGGGGGDGYGTTFYVGAAGGAGGGGAGGGAYPANGTINTGGGGGGQGGGIASGSNTPSTGGSGIILIWYPGVSRGTIQSGTGTTATFNTNTVHTLTSNAQIIFA